MWLAALLVLVLAGCVEVPPDASGAEVYAISCARCHGPALDGGTGPALGPGSLAADKSDESLITSVTNGRGRMPSFSNQLTPDQIAAVVEYMREIQGAE